MYLYLGTNIVRTRGHKSYGEALPAGTDGHHIVIAFVCICIRIYMYLYLYLGTNIVRTRGHEA